MQTDSTVVPSLSELCARLDELQKDKQELLDTLETALTVWLSAGWRCGKVSDYENKVRNQSKAVLDRLKRRS